ncbi:coiled-coil domain-containing protein, partial [Helicobacter ailurogastricus]|uniref:hypothetical protein n=1 Tax=Helicobacter ailurogastricus TaxID=1578720 RepID=UPI0013156CF2
FLALYGSDLFTQQDKEGLSPLNFGKLESNAKEMTKRAIKRYADREATLIQQKQELETSNAELNTQLNKLKGQHAKELKAKDTELTALKAINAKLTAQLSELKTTNAELTAKLNELIALVAPTDKKLTTEEFKGKLKEVRNLMIAINKLCGEDKIFTQEDYRNIKALEADNLEEGAKEIVSRALERFKARLVAPYTKEIEDLKTASALKDKQIASYKDHLSPEQVEGKITATKEQYKDYLSPKTAQELTDAKTKAETALAGLQTAHKALEAKYSALETSQTNNTQKLEELNTAHAKAVEELKTASALKDKQIVELTAQKQEAEQKASSLEKENEALRGSQYVVNVYANSRLKNSLDYERFFAVARDQGYPIVGFLVGKHICYFALKNPEWEDFKGSGLFLGRAKKPNYEALLLETTKRYYAKLLDWVGGNYVLEGVGWKSGLEIVERDDDKGIEGLSVGGDVDLATAIEKCYDYDRLAHWQEKERVGIWENVRIPPHASKAFETRIAPVWFKPRLEGLNIRLYDFLGKDLPQIDVVAFKDDWGLMRETMDYIASLNRQKLRDTHKEKRQQHAKGWYARSKVEKRAKQRAQEQAKQLKTNTPTPSKSKPTPKPTEPQKSPQPTQSTTPKKPLG